MFQILILFDMPIMKAPPPTKKKFTLKKFQHGGLQHTLLDQRQKKTIYVPEKKFKTNFISTINMPSLTLFYSRT
jgi:hypothetical protein